MPRMSISLENERRALGCAAFRSDGWLPPDGLCTAAKRLAKRGLLKECGIAAMPPHILYVVTEDGKKYLEEVS